MRKLIESTHVTLGGEIGSPQDWAFPYLDDEHMRYATALLAEADSLLLGRRTYEGLSAGYTAMALDPFVDRMNSIPKYVASRTLTEATWNATVIPGDVADFVAELKDQPGGNLLVEGSAQLVHTLAQHGLVDEYRLMVFPVILGQGKRLFPDTMPEPAKLTVADSRTVGSGVILLRLHPQVTA